MTPREIENERIKLAANALNGMAIATFAIGGLAPFVSVVAGTSSASPLAVGILAPLAIALSGGLHWVGRTILGELK